MASFLAWISTYGSIIGFFVQVAFYVLVAISAIWAAANFSRYVKYMTSDDTETEDDSEDESGEPEVEDEVRADDSEDVPVEEFVE